MNPDQIVAGLNRQNERLEEENKRLREEISTLASYYAEEIKNQAYTVYERDVSLQILSKQMEFLKGQISFIEASSAASAQASAEAIASLRQTLHHTQRDNQLLNYDLSQETVRLQEEIARIHQQSSESESQVREHLTEISELKSTALMNTIRYNESEQKVSLIESDLQSLSDKSDALVKARDDLIKRLNKSNNSLLHKNRRDKKALQDVNLLNGQLSEEVRKAEQQILECDRLKDSLRQEIANETDLQKELRNTAEENANLQRRLEYFRAEDIKQQHTISSIQRQLQNLYSEERAQGLQHTIHHKTVEIEKLTEQARKQEMKLEEKDRQIERLTATIKKSVATIQEKEATATRWKGEVLAHSIQSLDRLRTDKISISTEITDSVFQLLKGIDSARKANEAATAIRAFLATVNTRMIYATNEINKIKDLIANVTYLVDKADGQEAFKQLIDDVSSLHNALKSTANS
jgi:chromosome segregation ATPase